MPIVRFPDPETMASPEGIVGIGGDLHPQSLLLAYRLGIFPWPISIKDETEPVLAWFCPPKRAVLLLDRIHVPRSLHKSRKKAERDGLSFTIDQCFGNVIRRCADVPRKNSDGTTARTWITPALIQAYEQLHQLGYAHSVEVWAPTHGTLTLVAGLYGTCVEGVFAGESMFTTRNDASKLAVLWLAEKLRTRGATFIDIQMMTPHLQRLGAQELPRQEFLKLLKKEQAKGLVLFP